MAKIRMSAIGISQISGRIGGSVFAHNRGGMYVRNNGKAVNQQSAKQTALRSIFGSVSQAWGQLSEAQVRAWNFYGNENPKTDVFGESRPQSGFGAFVSANQNRLHAGFTGLLLMPREKIVIPSVAFSNVVIDKTLSTNTQIDLAFGGAVVANEVIASLGYAIIKQGQNRGFGSVKNKFADRIRKAIPAGAALQFTDVDLAPVLASVEPGDTVYFQLHLHTMDGQKGNEVTERTIVV